MSPEQQAAYVMAMAAAVMAETAAMQAANQQEIHIGKPPIYGETTFRALIDSYGIHHNAVLAMFRS